MKPSNAEAEKALRLLPEGTQVTVDGITGTLVFQFYPEELASASKAVLDYIRNYNEDYYDSLEEAIEDTVNDILKFYDQRGGKPSKKSPFERADAIRMPTEDELHLFYRYYDAYEFGIAYKQQQDYNVSPRDISKPFIKKGETVVCYSYLAEEYTVLK